MASDSSREVPLSPGCAVSAAARQLVVHVRQRRSWDCGIACVAMVVSMLECEYCGAPEHAAGLTVAAMSDDKAAPLLGELARLVATTSTWTADLAFLLSVLGVPCTLRSTHLGVDEGLEDMPFYRDHVGADRARVHGRLSAMRSGTDGTTERFSPVELIESATDLVVLRDAVRSGWLAVVLTDGRKLVTADGVLGAALMWAQQRGGDDGFAGHYVVVVAWSGRESSTACERVGILDPVDTAASLRWVSAPRFDAARLARGTDSDVILIQLRPASAAWVGRKLA